MEIARRRIVAIIETGVLLAALVAASSATAALQSSRVLRAVLHTADVAHSQPVGGSPGPYRTTDGLLDAWGLSPGARKAFAAAYGRAGFRAGAVNFLEVTKKHEWASVAVTARSPASAAVLIDEIHDMYLRWGSKVVPDAASPHAFRIDGTTGGSLTDSTVYAMNGTLVVEVEEWNARGITRLEVHRMMDRLLVRAS